MSNWNECDETSIDQVGSALSELFEKSTRVKNAKQRSSDGIRIVRAHASYWVQGENPYKVSQEVLLLESDDLDIPKFELRANQTGLVGAFSNAIADVFTDSNLAITFDDSPEFNKHFKLISWVEPATRILFSPDVRGYVENNPGWNVRGSNRFLLVFRNHAPNENQFVSSGLKLLSLLQAGEQSLDAQPNVAREASVAEIVEKSSKMGIFGAAVRKKMRQLAVSPEELDYFLKSASPRTIPIGIQRQVLGPNLSLLWGMFALFGLCALLAVFVIPGTAAKVVVGIFGLLFGGIGVGVAWRATQTKKKSLETLREGELTKGVLTSIRNTGAELNNVLFFKAEVVFNRDGKEVLHEFSIHCDAVSTARGLLNSGEPVRLLVKDETVVCLDVLTIWC